MNRPIAALITLFLVGASYPQRNTGSAHTASVRFHSNDGQFELLCRTFRGKMLSKTEGRIDAFDNVQLISKSQNVVLNGNQVTVLLNPNQKPVRISTATATGRVKMVKSADGGRQTQITGSRATYKGGDTLSHAQMEGPVQIVDSDTANHRVLDATGQMGSVVLQEHTVKGQSALISALLKGSVQVNLKQNSGKGAPGTLRAKGDVLIYDAASLPPTVVIKGHVQINGNQGAMSLASGSASQATLTLNADREVTGISYEAGT